MPLALRNAEPKDLPEITEIYNQAVAQRGATADLEPVTVEDRRRWLEGHCPEKYPVFVAEHGGRVVGWCSLSPHRPGRLALRFTAEISYYVHEAHRRTGVASALIAYAIGRCPGLEIKSLFAILLDVNEASVAILEKFGFARWGHLPNVAEVDGRECGQYIYGRRVE